MPTAVLAVIVSLRLFNISTASPATIEQAQRAVAQIYAAIGVAVEWNADRSALLLIVRNEEPGDLRRAAQPILGAAIHTEAGSPVAYVFYRRAVSEADRHGISRAIVLASAMAHEVGHLLLPAYGHARDGLMRACWDYPEFRRAASGELRFSAREAAAIRASVVGRMESQAEVTR